MRWRLIIVAVPALAAAPVFAAGDTPPLIADMDRYIQDPRGPGTYRALARMGDPEFGRAGSNEPASWELEHSARKLFGLDYGGDCRTDYAMKTYRERAVRLGAGHRYVDRWVKVQSAVFSACKGWNRRDRPVEPLPRPIALADPALDRLQRADRAYQAASQLFYLAKAAEARASFAAIAAGNGPHRSAGAYMVAAIDAGSASDKYKPAAPRPGAIAGARALLTAPKAGGMRAAAHELIGWMGASHDTRETRAAQVAVTLDALHLPLATIRSDPQAAERYRRSAEDLPRLWTAFDNADWWLTGAIPKGYFGSLAMAEAARTDRLAAFQLVPGPCRGSSCPSPAYALREDVEARLADSDKAGDRDAWRVAHAQLGGGYERFDHRAEIAGLIDRVRNAPTDHDVALLMLLADQQLHSDFNGTYRYDEAAYRADRLRGAALLERWPWPESAWFAQRYRDSLRLLAGNGFMAEARALRDRVGPRVTDRWAVPGELLLLIAEDREHFVQALVAGAPASSALIDRLPISRLRELVEDGRIAASDRARFARIAWTRSYLLDRRIPKDLDRLMRSLNPDVAASWRSKVGARTSDRALLLDVLRTPAMNLRAASRVDSAYGYGEAPAKPSDIDVYEHSLNNWWCGPVAVDFSQRDESVLADALGEGASRSAAERMLAESWAWQSLDRNERAALAARPMAPRLLAEAAVAWGERANPRRPDGADEALALAVRATRYGCQFQGGHGRWSKAAWDLLHQRFPGTDAARRTRWWFDCRHFTYGCGDTIRDDQAFVPAYDEDPASATEPKVEEAPMGASASGRPGPSHSGATHNPTG